MNYCFGPHYEMNDEILDIKVDDFATTVTATELAHFLEKAGDKGSQLAELHHPLDFLCPHFSGANNS